MIWVGSFFLLHRPYEENHEKALNVWVNFILCLSNQYLYNNNNTLTNSYA